MRRTRGVDAARLATAVTAVVVFAVAMCGVASVAVRAANPPELQDGVPELLQGGEGWTGCALAMETDSGALVPGGWANYLIFFELTAPPGMITETLRVTNTLPAGGQFVAAWWGEGPQPNAGEPLPQPVHATQTEVAWELGVASEQPRWFHVRVGLSQQLNPGQQLVDCAEIEPAADETTLLDNAGCAADTLNPLGPNLAVLGASEWRLPALDHLTYEARFLNVGTTVATAPVITTTLPAGTGLVGYSSDLPGVYCPITGYGTIVCGLPALAPGDAGRIWFEVDLDQPPEPQQVVTNTLQISLPQGDVMPWDNSATVVDATGGEVWQVGLGASTEHASLWAFTPLVEPTEWVTVTAPAGQYSAHPVAACRCVEFPDIGPVFSGDAVAVAAGSGSLPVTMTVPVPFDAAASSQNNVVSGQIGQSHGEPVEVALYGGPVRLVHTTAGEFQVAFPDVPRGSFGEVRYTTTAGGTTVVHRRSFYTPDLVLNVHSRDDWVEGPFEVGHTIWLTVTDSSGAVKATAQLETWFPPWWGGLSGFTTRIDGAWSPQPPDIVPGDYVHGIADTGSTASVRVGDITAQLDFASDIVAGTVTAPWLAGPLPGECLVLSDFGPAVGFDVDPNGGSYSCDFGLAGWDLQESDQVLVRYWQPDAHSVMNQFPEPSPQPVLGIFKGGDGAGTPGGNFEYVIVVWNEGDAAAEAAVLTDTLPAGMTYLADTLGVPITVVGQEVMFNLGTIEPGAVIGFSLFAGIGAITDTVTNVVEIEAPSAITATASVDTSLMDNSTDLTVSSVPDNPAPAPDTDVVWDVEVCNIGATASSDAELTDLLPPEMAALSWWADQAGWIETLLTPQQLVVVRPTVPAGQCLQLHLVTHVSANAYPGQQLCNVVAVAAANDVDPMNNLHESCVTVPGGAPAVAIEKATNGEDADAPPGPSIPVGAPVQWSYEVVNTGGLLLENVVVDDNRPGVNPSCPQTTLEPGAAMVCEAFGVAVEGQYSNVGTVTATPAGGGDPVGASDPSHYLGVVGLPFGDGFESGDTSAWSATVP